VLSVLIMTEPTASGTRHTSSCHSLEAAPMAMKVAHSSRLESCTARPSPRRLLRGLMITAWAVEGGGGTGGGVGEGGGSERAGVGTSCVLWWWWWGGRGAKPGERLRAPKANECFLTGALAEGRDDHGLGC